MSSLITVGLLLLVVIWAVASYGRLVRLRAVVSKRWRDAAVHRKRLLDLQAKGTSTGSKDDLHAATRAFDEARQRYNVAAARYNADIAAIPGNIFAGLAGFKRAELLQDVDPVASSDS